ncbi:MAG: Mov34/MPN/PAD-1 family protein [Phycisphaerae bacterium]
MREVSVSAEVRERVGKHALAGYPEEVCGILVGCAGRVLRVVEVQNGAGLEQKRGEYVVDPRDILRVDRQARERGWEIVGYYHSHPDHRAVPSEVDRALAWEGVLYVIVSVTKEGAGEMRGWVMGEGRAFGEVKLFTTPPATESRRDEGTKGHEECRGR